MTFSKEFLTDELREVSGTITFKKKDGSDRKMKCTLQPDVIVPYEKKTDRVREVNDNILPVWDLEANAWRSINIDTISSVVFDR